MIEKEEKLPYINEIITKPLIFWNELNIQLMASQDVEKKLSIVKVMCVLYINQSQILKEVKEISLWLKMLENPATDTEL